MKEVHVCDTYSLLSFFMVVAVQYGVCFFLLSSQFDQSDFSPFFPCFLGLQKQIISLSYSAHRHRSIANPPPTGPPFLPSTRRRLRTPCFHTTSFRLMPPNAPQIPLLCHGRPRAGHPARLRLLGRHRRLPNRPCGGACLLLPCPRRIPIVIASSPHV
jgi:hypothetical protein